MIAMSILTVLGIAVGALQFSLQSSNKQFFHAYYNERTLAVIDGITAIARGVAQDQLGTLIANRGEAMDLTEAVVEKARSLRLWREGSDWEPSVSVLARVDPEKLRHFAADAGSAYQTILEAKDTTGGTVFEKGHEVEGLVELETQVGFSNGIRAPNFVIPKRKVKTEYEFKRLLRVPRFFRQFALYVKDAVPEGGGGEHHEFAGRKGYNRVGNDMRGYGGGGSIFVSPGGNLDGSQLPRAEANPFQTATGYVYLGGDEPIYLNLAAGNDDSEYSEKFQLYKGATTDFYKVWRTDFSSFVEQAKQQGDGGSSSGGGIGGFVSRAWNWVRNKLSGALRNLREMVEVMDQLDELEARQGGRNDGGPHSSALPLYYFVRKDYGYAKEWGQPQYKRFGFGLQGGEDVNSAALKLYGVKNPTEFRSSGLDGDPEFAWDGPSMGATLVMGKVYRRNLSLGGYKQRRGDYDPSEGQSFEVQAGPIEFFDDWDAMVKRKGVPIVGGSAPADDEKPIWVWDARVDWNRHAKATNGTWYPISGWGLAGRLLPGMARFWSEEGERKAAKLLEASMMPPREILRGDVRDVRQAAETLSNMRQLADMPSRFKGGVSPLVLTLSKKGFFNSGRGSGPWVDVDGAPYFEELARCFAYASYLTDEELRAAAQGLSVGETVGLTPDGDRDDGDAPDGGFSTDDIRQALINGALLWNRLKAAPGVERFSSDDLGSAYPAPNPRAPSKGDFWKHSEDTASADEDVFPFSLPDPWSKPDSSGGGSGGPVPKLKNNFQEAFEDKFGSKQDEVFDKYIRPVMTDPARVQPYNYSMRFMFEEIKALFGKKEEERAALLAREVAPEVREGIGFRVPGENDYLQPEDTSGGSSSGSGAAVEGVKFDRAMDDEVLQEIYQARSGSDYLKKGFFFMDEYGKSTTTPKEVDLAEPTRKGGRYCWYDLTEDEFRDRFGPTDGASGRIRSVNYGNSAHVRGDFGIFSEGPTIVRGGGVLFVEGTVTISHSLTSDQKLTIIADKVVLKGDLGLVRAVIIAREVEFGSGSFVLNGSLACEKWNAAQEPRAGRILVAYDSGLKAEESFVQVIEPRIHRMTISGVGEDG